MLFIADLSFNDPARHWRISSQYSFYLCPCNYHMNCWGENFRSCVFLASYNITHIGLTSFFPFVIIFSFLPFLKHRFMSSSLALSLIFCWGWPWISGPPASTSRVWITSMYQDTWLHAMLGLKPRVLCVVRKALWTAELQSQPLTHRMRLYCDAWWMVIFRATTVNP